MPSTAWGIALALLLLVHAASAAGTAEGPSAAQLPSATVDTAAVEPSGRAIVVPSGGDLQAAGDASPAAAGTRIDPGQAPKLAKLVAASGAVVKAAPGAHHYRLSGLEIRPTEGAFLYNLVEIGSAETSTEEVPHHVIV